MTTVFLPPVDHCNVAKDFVASFNANNHWFFIADHTDHASSVVPNANSDIDSFYTNPWKQMILGKQLTSNNVKQAILNKPYVANKAFAMYDNEDINLLNEDYYCVVNAGSYSHVFMCLDNNQGANSTVQPDFTQITGANVTIYETADNYRWKYLYSVDSTTVASFATTTYFPYVANSATAAAAVKGSINIIKVVSGGKLYNNYTFGSFATSDLRIGGDQTTYALSNSAVSSSNGFYTGCIIYLTSGTGVGQYKNIINYISNTSGNYIVVDSAFTTAPLNGTAFEIYPSVNVVSTGVQTSNVVARAIIDSTLSNTVARIEVLEPGTNYTSATAAVIANSAVGVTSTATLRPILPPRGGHGAFADVELNGRYVIISQTLSNTESNTIPATNKCQQIGILKDPTFNTAELTLSSPSAFFVSSETAYIVSPATAAINVTSNSSTAVITGDTKTDFVNQFSANDYLILTDGSTTYGLVQVNSITNSTSLTLTANSPFTGSSLILKYPNISANLTVTGISSETDITTNNIHGTFGTGSIIIGAASGAYATVNTVSRNSVTKTFKTFVQLNKYSISMIAGSFAQNETVTQGNTNALVHSYDGSNLFVSNQTNAFAVGVTHLIGQTSGAVASVTQAFPLELVSGDGEIIYLENIDAITRQTSQNETFKLINSF